MTTAHAAETSAAGRAIRPADLAGLAESRGLPLASVVLAAIEDRLADVVRLPTILHPRQVAFLATGTGRAWRRADVTAWCRLTGMGC